ncbi:MAG: hypothetical protein WCI22_14905, partial [Actinomycetota bacterium]
RYAAGLRAHVIASWQSTNEQIWDAQIAGELGVLRAELQPAYVLEYNGDEVALPILAGEMAPVVQLGYLGQLQAMNADLAAGREPVMSAAFGREVLQVVLAAYTSAARAGEEVALPFSGPRDLTPLQLWRQR